MTMPGRATGRTSGNDREHGRKSRGTRCRAGQEHQQGEPRVSNYCTVWNCTILLPSLLIIRVMS